MSVHALTPRTLLFSILLILGLVFVVVGTMVENGLLVIMAGICLITGLSGLRVPVVERLLGRSRRDRRSDRR